VNLDRALLTHSYREHVWQLSASYGSVLANAGYDALVIHSGSPLSRSSFDDQYWPLRVTPHFQHWLPLRAAESALVIEPGRKPRLLWVQERSFWEAPEPFGADFWQDSFEIVQLPSKDAVRAELPNTRSAYIGERAHAANWGFVDAAVTPPALLSALDALRIRKTQYEELCLAEANRCAAVGHKTLAHAFQSGAASELDLHLLFLGATRQDALATPYQNIVALNENAATLHHVSYRRSEPARTSEQAAQSLLVDAGATCYGYCSDITRTHVKGLGAAASAFASLLAAVETFQQTLCSEIRVGAPYESLHDRAHEHVAEALRTSGIVKLSAAEAVSGGITRAFFPHGLGHSLGLQTHDVGCASLKPRADNPFLRNTTTISERQCFTIEPGIYFIAGLLEPLRSGPHAHAIDWQLVAELGRLGGIRVEDDIVVLGADATRNLTREFLPL
jgi:Xaa-Pro dipeptidase